MRHREGLHLVNDVRGLGLFAAKEFFSCREIEKNRLDLDRGSRGAATVRDRFNATSGHADFRARRRLARAGGQAKPRHTRDARQRLAAKSHRRDRCQILRQADLARRMPLQAQQRIIAIHPAAVVHHAEETGSATREFHHDPARSGIDAVFDEFLHHRGGALHDLARRHLTGDLIGEQANSSHEFDFARNRS